jgi:putative inorganic carbon (HCO3(-)) transporter
MDTALIKQWRRPSLCVACEGPADDKKRSSAPLAFYLTFASAASILFSIAISQILMALALAALLLSGEPLRLPPVKLPLFSIALTTVIALLLSPDPYAGLPQIRKFYVFAILLLLSSTLTDLGRVRALVIAWAGIATLSAVRGFTQFLARRHDAFLEHANNYGFYLDDRVRGFAGHWMTFGGEQMIVVLLLASAILFSRRRGDRILAWICLPILWAAIVLSLTRSVFLLGVPAGTLYLIWRWKPWTLAAVPALAVAAYFAAPFQVRDRVISVLHPHGDLDSNSHRRITRRVGWEMVKAHPWFGLGPEQIGPQFGRYVPADIPRPLPRGWYGHLHNIYLQYAAERGIPGLLAVLWLIGRALRDFLRAFRSGRLNGDAVFLLHGAVAAILAILAEGFFEYNLGDSEVLTMFLSVMACGYAAAGDRQCG